MSEKPEPIPESEIEDRYKPGTGTHPCPECGLECDIEHSVIEFSEYIYCEDCRMKFTRERKPLVETDYETDAEQVVEERKEDKDNYVRFRCTQCDTDALDQDYRVHERSLPKGCFDQINTGMSGYDDNILVCPCGEEHNGYLDIGQKIHCDCGRVYELSVTV